VWIERLGSPLERVLRSRVKAHEGRWQESEDAAYEHDSAGALLAHDWKNGPRHAHGAEEVHVEELLCLPRVGLFDGSDDRCAGVVDEHVDPPGAGEDLGD